MAEEPATRPQQKSQAISLATSRRYMVSRRCMLPADLSEESACDRNPASRYPQPEHTCRVPPYKTSGIKRVLASFANLTKLPG